MIERGSIVINGTEVPYVRQGSGRIITRYGAPNKDGGPVVYLCRIEHGTAQYWDAVSECRPYCSELISHRRALRSREFVNKLQDIIDYPECDKLIDAIERIHERRDGTPERRYYADVIADFICQDIERGEAKWSKRISRIVGAITEDAESVPAAIIEALLACAREIDNIPCQGQVLKKYNDSIIEGSTRKYVESSNFKRSYLDRAGLHWLPPAKKAKKG